MTEDTRVTRLLEWPRETWSSEERALAAERRGALQIEMRSLLERAERADRNLTAEERQEWNALQDEFARLA